MGECGVVVVGGLALPHIFCCTLDVAVCRSMKYVLESEENRKMIITLYASVTTVLQFWNRHVGDCSPGKTFQGYVRSNYSRKCCHSRILGFYHS